MHSRVQLTPTTSTTSIVSRLDTHLSSTGFRHVHRRPRIKRPRKGSGPFQSVRKERSVDFNLTLDVQRLQQEIQQLTMARNLLQSRRLQRRESPTGSLMQIVRQFFQPFRQGFRVEQHHTTGSARRHVITAGAQSDFLYSVVDEEIDFGHGLRGVACMVEIIRRYSLLLRFIRLQMDSVEIVTMADNDDDHEEAAGPRVLIVATGSIRFQVLRETIAGLFPHIVGNETLCARLIGADVVAANVVRFYFDARSRIWRYEFDVDYVACFSRVLGDLRSVSELLGRSRIGDKSMFGVSKDGRLEALELDEEDGEDEEELASAITPSHVASARPTSSPSSDEVALKSLLRGEFKVVRSFSIRTTTLVIPDEFVDHIDVCTFGCPAQGIVAFGRERGRVWYRLLVLLATCALDSVRCRRARILLRRRRRRSRRRRRRSGRERLLARDLSLGLGALLRAQAAAVAKRRDAKRRANDEPHQAQHDARRDKHDRGREYVERTIHDLLGVRRHALGLLESSNRVRTRGLESLGGEVVVLDRGRLGSGQFGLDKRLVLLHNGVRRTTQIGDERVHSRREVLRVQLVSRLGDGLLVRLERRESLRDAGRALLRRLDLQTQRRHSVRREHDTLVIVGRQQRRDGDLVVQLLELIAQRLVLLARRRDIALERLDLVLGLDELRLGLRNLGVALAECHLLFSDLLLELFHSLLERCNLGLELIERLRVLVLGLSKLLLDFAHNLRVLSRALAQLRLELRHSLGGLVLRLRELVLGLLMSGLLLRELLLELRLLLRLRIRARCDLGLELFERLRVLTLNLYEFLLDSTHNLRVLSLALAQLRLKLRHSLGRLVLGLCQLLLRLLLRRLLLRELLLELRLLLLPLRVHAHELALPLRSFRHERVDLGLKVGHNLG